MKQISIVEYRKNIYKYLHELPFEIVAKGKVLFIVSPPDVSTLQVSTVAPKKEHVSTVDVSTLDKVKKTTDKKIKTFNLEQSHKALIRSKHGGQLIGSHYTCCE